MSNRLGDVQNRLGTVRELESVVSAMRGIAGGKGIQVVDTMPVKRPGFPSLGAGRASPGMTRRAAHALREPLLTLSLSKGELVLARCGSVRSSCFDRFSMRA